MLGAFLWQHMVTSPITKKANGFWDRSRDNCCHYKVMGWAAGRCFIFNIIDERLTPLINRFTKPRVFGKDR